MKLVRLLNTVNLKVMSKILMPSAEKQLKFGSAYVSESLGMFAKKPKKLKEMF